MGRSRWVASAVGVVLVGALARCAGSGDEAGGLSGPRADNGGPGAAVGGSGAIDGGGVGTGGAGAVSSGGNAGTGPPPPPPPETEVEATYRSPVATGRYVWSANPDSGRVALVDARTLEVTTVEAGFAPTYLAAIPGGASAGTDSAIVLNAQSDDATLLTVDGGEIASATVETHAGANAWSVSGSGRWAIAWSDSTAVESPDATEGFQDVTVIDLAGEEPVSTRLTVGYRPVKIEITEDESRAYAVTEPGITVLELDDPLGPRVSHDVAVTDDPFDDPASRDVSITPDGTLALVRRVDRSEINVVGLPGGRIVPVELPGFVTDVDLNDDGSVAYAVTRYGNASDVSILPLPEIYDDPSLVVSRRIEGETFGSVSVSSDGRTALVYTNAEPNDHLTVVIGASMPRFVEHRTVSLKAPVGSVFVTPDARHSIALLDPGASSAKAGAFAVVPVVENLPAKIQGTDARPFAVALSPGPVSDRAVIVTRDVQQKIFDAYLVRMPELQVDRLPLSSPPVAAGIVAGAGVAYVAQAHPEGRISFIDLDRGSVRTLTGFELDSRVVDGS